MLLFYSHSIPSPPSIFSLFLLILLLSIFLQGVIGANAEVTKGEHARMSSFVGAIAVADLVKTTLGPKGMDKILQSVSDDMLCVDTQR